MTEAALERAVCKEVQNRGGVAWKWVSPGRAGVPDRICILPNNIILFVELKRPGRSDGRSPVQRRVFEILERLGCKVWLINDLEEFRSRLDDL